MAVWVLLSPLASPPASAAPGLPAVDWDLEVRRAERQFRKLEERIARERDREEAGRRRRRSLLQKLDGLSARLALADQRLRVLARKVRRAEAKAGTLREELNRFRAEQVLRRRRLKSRLRTMYMEGSIAPVRVVVMSRSLRDFLDRWALLTWLARYDLRLIARFRAKEKTLEQLEAEAEKERRKLAALRNRRGRAKRRVAVLYARRSRQLEQIEKDKAKRRALLRELGRARETLRNVIASLHRMRETRLGGRATAFTRLKGRLRWPVAGRTLPRGEEQGGRGVRIRAPDGSPIRPAAPGEVVFSDWVRGYGRMVILRHDGGYYTVYGGAGEVLVEAGERVSGDRILGRVGRTEALGGEMLYFEIRKGAIPMDPLRWLSRRPE